MSNQNMSSKFLMSQTECQQVDLSRGGIIVKYYGKEY